MSNTKEKIEEYLPTLRARLKKETDPRKKFSLRVKIEELKQLRDQL